MIAQDIIYARRLNSQVTNRYYIIYIILDYILFALVNPGALNVMHWALATFIVFFVISQLSYKYIYTPSKIHLVIFPLIITLFLLSFIVYKTGFFQSPFLFKYFLFLLSVLIITHGIKQLIMIFLVLLSLLIQGFLYRYSEPNILFSVIDKNGNFILRNLIIFSVSNFMVLTLVVVVIRNIFSELRRKAGISTQLAQELKEANKQITSLRAHKILKGKLESIELLAQGVAHEINNPLEVIIGCANLLEKEMELDKKTANWLRNIEEGVRRIRRIIESLVPFGDTYEEARKINISENILDVVHLIRSKLEALNIKLHLDLDRHILLSLGEGSFKRALLNLLENAVYAIERGGEISIKCYSDDNHGVVEILDSGRGIKASDVDKIFNPFYTTKEVGAGYGLGLYYVYLFVKEYNGDISVESKEGVGTKIKLYFSID